MTGVMQMNHLLIPAAAAIAAVALAVFLIRWRRTAVKSKQNREQIDRKIKEDALDRALSNGPRQRGKAQSQAPVGIYYNSTPKRENGEMLRLTEQGESVTKEYLFQRTDVIYIGEEYGRSAVFQERGRGKLHCELFPHDGSVYVRLHGRSEGRLIRGKKTAPLTTTAVRLHSGDRIETKTGIYLVEFISSCK